jgi:hypothetical protein
MEQLEELFRSWGDIFSENAERPAHIRDESIGEEFLKQLQ